MTSNDEPGIGLGSVHGNHPSVPSESPKTRRIILFLLVPFALTTACCIAWVAANPPSESHMRRRVEYIANMLTAPEMELIGRRMQVRNDVGDFEDVFWNASRPIAGINRLELNFLGHFPFHPRYATWSHRFDFRPSAYDIENETTPVAIADRMRRRLVEQGWSGGRLRHEDIWINARYVTCFYLDDRAGRWFVSIGNDAEGGPDAQIHLRIRSPETNWQSIIGRFR